MTTPRRGRPPAYDRDAALSAAMTLFLRNGYSATSLDELAAATGMNRPSLYRAFGNKEALYRAAFRAFVDGLRASSGRALEESPTLAEALEGFYQRTLDAYFETTPALGCFVFCTAPAEAPANPLIAGELAAVVEELDETLLRRFRLAQRQGELPASANCRDAARLAQALLHSLAVRARAGESRRALNRLARHGAAMILAGAAAAQ